MLIVVLIAAVLAVIAVAVYALPFAWPPEPTELPAQHPGDDAIGVPRD